MNLSYGLYTYYLDKKAKPKVSIPSVDEHPRWCLTQLIRTTPEINWWNRPPTQFILQLLRFHQSGRNRNLYLCASGRNQVDGEPPSCGNG